MNLFYGKFMDLSSNHIFCFVFYHCYKRNSFLFQEELPSIKRKYRSCVILSPREQDSWYLKYMSRFFFCKHISHNYNFKRNRHFFFSPKALCSYFHASWIIPHHPLVSIFSLSLLLFLELWTYSIPLHKGRRESYNFPSILALCFLSLH